MDIAKGKKGTLGNVCGASLLRHNHHTLSCSPSKPEVHLIVYRHSNTQGSFINTNQFILLVSRIVLIFLVHGATAPIGPGPPHYLGFTITLRHTTLSRTPLDEWSDRRRDLYLKTHNTHKRQTSMPPAGFEHTIPGSERQQTHALDLAATGIGEVYRLRRQNVDFVTLRHTIQLVTNTACISGIA